MVPVPTWTLSLFIPHLSLLLCPADCQEKYSQFHGHESLNGILWLFHKLQWSRGALQSWRKKHFRRWITMNGWITNICCCLLVLQVRPLCLSTESNIVRMGKTEAICQIIFADLFSFCLILDSRHLPQPVLFSTSGHIWAHISQFFWPVFLDLSLAISTEKLSLTLNHWRELLD